MQQDCPVLGVGIGYREPLRGELFLNRERVDFLEIVADHFLDASPERLGELDLLAEHFTLIPHAIHLSLGSAEGLDPVYVHKLAALVRRLNPPWWSEHIAFTRAGGVEIGHLTPLPFCNEAIAAIGRNVDHVRRYIETPLILENITYVMESPGGEMREGEFLRRVLERTDCGLLLDVTNLHTNAHNHGDDARTMLDELPLDRVVQLHFAGGYAEGDLLIDSHSHATPDPVWALLDEVVSRTPVRGVILERDEDIPAFAELLPEIERARQIGRMHGRWT